MAFKESRESRDETIETGKDRVGHEPVEENHPVDHHPGYRAFKERYLNASRRCRGRSN